jgi:antitoxin ParD1/3/4
MGKNTSISLGEHFESFIQNGINTGRYNSASEIIRSALRLLETEENKANELRKALELGENSKIIDDFNPVANLKDLHKRYL